MDPDPWEAICDFNDHPLWITYSRNLSSGAIALDPRKSFAYQLLYEKPSIQLRFDKKNVHLYNFSYTILSRESEYNHKSTKEYNMAVSISAESPASTASWSFDFKFEFSEISERICSIASRCFECLKSLWDRAATAVSSFFTRAPVVSPFSVDENSSAGGAKGIKGAVDPVLGLSESTSEESKAQELAGARSGVARRDATIEFSEV